MLEKDGSKSKSFLRKGANHDNVKEVLSLALCLLLVLCIPLSASAASSTGDYFEFKSGPERMNSDGTFVFNVTQYVISDTFTAKSNRIWIETDAVLFNTDTAMQRVDSSFYFTLDLYKASNGQRVNGYIGYANGIRGGNYFDVSSGEKYYFKITPYGFLYTNEVLNGAGLVTPVTCP